MGKQRKDRLQNLIGLKKLYKAVITLHVYFRKFTRSNNRTSINNFQMFSIFFLSCWYKFSVFDIPIHINSNLLIYLMFFYKMLGWLAILSDYNLIWR